MSTVLETSLGDFLPLLSTGKVREIYKLPAEQLLFITTDRISAYDIVLSNGIPQKGAILTQLSEFWFRYLSTQIPTLHTHFLSPGIPPQILSTLPPHLQKPSLPRRSMTVKSCRVFPIESIVRGYLSGSAWSSYQKDNTVNGISLPPNLLESSKLETPLWTPSTKAPLGEKDENISPAHAAEIVGTEYCDKIAALSLQIYEIADAYALERGIIIADTKFEFALDESIDPPEVVLVDEVLTPDSSRFWSKESYEAGRSQESYDKQPLRDWLVKTGQKGKNGVEMPEDIVEATTKRYQEAYEKLVGKKWDHAID
ncbi:MAG: Bifunctional purine biosynthetic protein ade1 [Candelina submexicana]|nr:MAG: Bifunctional purine biosynthetic protein ade1 [Candelina submexicana]